MLLNKDLRSTAEDPHIKTPELRNTYVELFINEAFGDHARLGIFGIEALVECDDAENLKTADFIEIYDKTVKDLLYSDKLRDKEEACKLKIQEMNDYNKAESYICDVLSRMSNYSKYAKYLIDTKPYEINDEFVPVFAENLDNQANKKTCIYHYLFNVSPVTTQFLIYDIIDRLEDKAKKLKEEISDIELAYKDEDFDSKVQFIRSPLESLDKLSDKLYTFWKTHDSVVKSLYGKEKALTKLAGQLSEVVDAHILTVRKFMVNNIKYHVSNIILERLYELADIYRLFLTSISEIADENNNYIKQLENIRLPYNQYGIYCSTDAFRKMASDFMALQPQDISFKAKKAIVDQLFTAYFRSFSISDQKETNKERDRRYQIGKKKFKSLFQDTVLSEIRSSVVEHGKGIVNLTAREALIKEIELKEQLLPEDEGYYETVEKSIKTAVNHAMIQAVPMLRTGLSDSISERLIFILSPDCAGLDPELQPDVEETARFYLSDSSDADVMINSEAPDTELTIIRLGYHYSIEDILNYRPGSENENAYVLETKDLGTGMKDMYSSTAITPHLDKSWHEEGVIPTLHTKQRPENHSD